MVGVAWSGSDDEFAEFRDQHGLTFPQIADLDGSVYSRFGIAAQPAFALVKSNGDVETIFGAVDETVLDNIVS